MDGLLKLSHILVTVWRKYSKSVFSDHWCETFFSGRLSLLVNNWINSILNSPMKRWCDMYNECKCFIFQALTTVIARKLCVPICVYLAPPWLRPAPPLYSTPWDTRPLPRGFAIAVPAPTPTSSAATSAHVYQQVS